MQPLQRSAHGGRVIRGNVHHGPWPLQEAAARIERDTVCAAAGVQLPDVAPLLHLSARQDVLIWPPLIAGRQHR